MRSDPTLWQFSIFSKSCEDAEQRWTYAAVSVQDHETVGLLFDKDCIILDFVSVNLGMLHQE